MTSTFTKRLALIVAAGLAVRVGYALTLASDLPVMGDALHFHWLANNLAGGEGWIRPYEFELEGVRQPTAEHPPLFVLWLALFSKLGLESFAAHRLASCLLGAATVAIVGLLGRRVGGERVGLVAAALAAIYPLLWGIDGSIMSESLYALAVAAILLAAIETVRRPSHPRFAVLGALIGAAALTRSEAIILPALLGVPVALLAVRPWRARVACLVVLGAAFAAVLSPWLVRNALTFDRLVPVTTTSGPLLAGSNCEGTYAGETLGLWRLDCVIAAEDRVHERLGTERFKALNEAERADLVRVEGRRFVADNADRVPRVLAVRLLRAWDLYRPRQQAHYETFEGRHLRVQQAGVAMYFLLLPLAAAGAWALRRRRDVLVPLLVPFALVSLTCVLGYGLTRLRVSAEIPIVVMASIALVRLTARIHDRRRRDLGPREPALGTPAG